MGLAAVLLLILAHGFFVAGEFGLVAVDRNRVQQLAEDGNRRAASTLQALKNLSFQLSGAQLGITITSLVVGFIAEGTIGRVLEPLLEAVGLPEGSTLGISIVLALGLATAVEMVVGELVPKNVAIAKPTETALGVATLLRLYNALVKPLVLFLNGSANWTVRRLGIEPVEEMISVRSLEEIELLIRSSRTEGALHEEEFTLLARSIDFEGKTAAHALLPRTAVVALHVDDSLAHMIEVALETGHSRFPVYGKDLDDIIGMAHVKDSYRFETEERDSKRVSEIVQDALVVPESRDLVSLLLEIRRARKHMAIVLDEYGGTAGIITLEDILEEIVGDIEDEYDPSASDTHLTSPPEGTHVVSAMLHPDEVREMTGFEVPEGDYETLAGFLLSTFSRIPEAGDHTSLDGWELRVVEMDGRRISKVEIAGPHSVPPEQEAT